MSLIVILKLLCDVSFYLSIASSFGDKYGTQPFQILPILLLAACWFVSFLLREKGLLRFLPLLGLALLVPLLPSRADLILFAPPAVYCVVLAVRDIYGVGQDGYAPMFSVMARILLGYLVFAIFFVGKEGLERVVLPYVLLYLVCSVLLLRLSRLDEATLSQPRFQLMNLGYVGGVLALTLLCASDRFLTLAKAVGGFVAYYIIRPIINAVLFVVAGGLLYVAEWVYKKFFANLDLETEASQELIDFINQPRPFDQFGEDVVIATPLWAKVIITIFVCSIVGFCLYQLYRRLAAGGSVRRGVTVRESSASSQRRVRPEARTPNGKVRQEYRRFLRLCRKSKLPLNPCLNSEQVEVLASGTFDPEALSDLRQIYTRVRYGGPPAGDADVKAAKQALRRLKASRGDGPEDEEE